jgi:hypothetical protein
MNKYRLFPFLLFFTLAFGLGHLSSRYIFQSKLKVDTQEKNIPTLDDNDSEIFRLKNEIERIKNIPNNQKDIVRLLITLDEIENLISIKTDLSDEFIKFFSIASKIPFLSDVVTVYKKEIYSSLYQMPDSNMIMYYINKLKMHVVNENSIKDKSLHFIKRLYCNLKLYTVGNFYFVTQKSSDFYKLPLHLEQLIEKKDYIKAHNLLLAVAARANNNLYDFEYYIQLESLLKVLRDFQLFNFNVRSLIKETVS